MTLGKWIGRICMLLVSVVIVSGIAGTLLVGDLEAANGEACEPGHYSSCPANYICKKKVCVCVWGNFEIGWPFLKGSPKTICDLIGTSGESAEEGVWTLAQDAITVVVALTVMAGLVSIVVGGYFYMTAGGNADRVRIAKIWIGSAILGIILALLSWLILASIANNLVGI